MLKTELELIGRERPAGEQLDGAVASAIDEADRLATLTQDLLVLARSDADRLPATVETVRVSGLLAAVGRRYAGVEVGGGLDPPDLEVRVEPARIERALANMVDNALRHGAMPVRVAARAVDGCVELHVTDAGPGFPAEFAPRAFERFARAEAGRTTTGTGLGLAIVESIAQAHGGSAHAANRDGGGADIWIAIPGGISRGGAR
jgi:signal transduction histidine kinase